MINNYLPEKVQIKEIKSVSPSVKDITLKKEVSFNSGQFVQISIPSVGEAPFTISSSPFDKNITITVNNVGTLTSELHKLKKGDFVGFRGPYGNGFNIEYLKNKDVNIISGGCGFAPVRSLIFYLLKNKNSFGRINFVYGARSPKDVLCSSEVKKWSSVRSVITVDSPDNLWKGHKGVVTDLLTAENISLNGVNVIVGPPVMMKYSVLKLKELGVKDEDIHLSLERLMYCAVGRCEHCRVGKYLVCRDGPVFSYSQIKDCFRVES